MTFPQMRQGSAMILHEAVQGGTRSHMLSNELARLYHWKVNIRLSHYAHQKN